MVTRNSAVSSWWPLQFSNLVPGYLECFWSKMTTSLVVSLMVNFMKCQWSSPFTPTYPFSDVQMSTAYCNQIIYILGGNNNAHQITEYNITNSSFTKLQIHIPYASDYSYYGWSQYWSQINNTLFISRGQYHQNTYLEKFNLINKEYNAKWTVVPTYRADRACLASSSTHLYIVGGLDWDTNNLGLTTMDIFNVISNSWETGPEMSEGRRAHACIVSNNNKLFAIGGWNRFDSHATSRPTDTVEYISIDNIRQNSWQYTTNNMSIGLWALRVLKYGKNLYTIGGNDYETPGDNPRDIVHIIDSHTNIITVSNHSLAIAVYATAAIAVNGIFYTFGGHFRPGESTNRLQYTTLSVGTIRII